MASSAVSVSVSTIGLMPAPGAGKAGASAHWSLRQAYGSCGRRHAEEVPLGGRGVPQDVLDRQRLVGLVLRPGVDEVEWVRRRRHVGKIELRHLRDGVEDRVQLAGQALDLVVAEVEPCEPCDV